MFLAQLIRRGWVKEASERFIGDTLDKDIRAGGEKYFPTTARGNQIFITGCSANSQRTGETLAARHFVDERRRDDKISG